MRRRGASRFCRSASFRCRTASAQCVTRREGAIADHPDDHRKSRLKKGGHMSPSVFWRTIVTGVVATFVMTMTGFWQHGVGIRPLDFGAILATNMSSAHPGTAYGIFAGNLAHFTNGVLFAFLWVALLRQYVAGSWLVHGLVYGIVLAIVASLIGLPLVADTGVFFTRMPAPGAMLLATAIMHLAYGFALCLSLEVARIGARAADRVAAEGVRLEIWPRRERRRA